MDKNPVCHKTINSSYGHSSILEEGTSPCIVGEWTAVKNTVFPSSFVTCHKSLWHWNLSLTHVIRGCRWRNSLKVLRVNLLVHNMIHLMLTDILHKIIVYMCKDSSIQCRTKRCWTQTKIELLSAASVNAHVVAFKVFHSYWLFIAHMMRHSSSKSVAPKVQRLKKPGPGQAFYSTHPKETKETASAQH